MIDRLRGVVRRLEGSIAGGAALVGIASLASRVLGLVRDRLFTTNFGSSALTDSYFAAFKIPDFIFNLLVVGALSAAFVPLFISEQTAGGKARAMQFATRVMTVLGVLVIIVSIVAAIAAPWLIQALAYGDTPDQQAVIVSFTRLMLVSTIFFALANVLTAVLHAVKQFVVYAFAPLLYNIGIIVGIIWLYPWLGIYGLPLGVIIGSLGVLLVQLPAAARIGFRWRWDWTVRQAAMRRFLRLLPPRALALGLTQLNTTVLFALASTLPVGARSIWQYADNLQHLPINIIGVSIGIAAFPALSEASSKSAMVEFDRIASRSLRQILFYMIPLTIVTMTVSTSIVRIVYGSGAFTWLDAQLTGETLTLFALSMLAQATLPLLNRVFFAKHNTITPVVVSVVMVIANVLLALYLRSADYLPLSGTARLALAFSIASIVHALVLFGLSQRRGQRRWWAWFGQLPAWLLLGSGSLIVAVFTHWTLLQFLSPQSFWGALAICIIQTLVCSAVYLGIATGLHLPEARVVVNRLRQLRLRF